MPHPLSSAESTFVSKTGFPNEEFAIPAHSPFSAGFSRSQSGTNSLLLSVHVRVVVVLNFELGLLATYVLLFCAASRYLPTFTLIAVRPVPNTSHATPPRGE